MLRNVEYMLVLMIVRGFLVNLVDVGITDVVVGVLFIVPTLVFEDAHLKDVGVYVYHLVVKVGVVIKIILNNIL